jgi:hypothetical protein
MLQILRSPIFKGWGIVVYCLLAPNALANPIQTASTTEEINSHFTAQPILDKTDQPNKFASLESTCAIVQPVTSAIAPTGMEKLEKLAEQPTSGCAKDLLQTANGDPTANLPLIVGQDSDGKEYNPQVEEQPTDDTADVNLDESSDWHFKLQPYATIPFTTYGTNIVKGREVDYHLDLDKLIDVLNFTASVRTEAWKSNLGFIFDAFYVSLGDDLGVELNRLPNGSSIESSLKYNQGIYDIAFSYHFGDPAPFSLPDEPSNKSFPQVWFEPIIGARINYLKATIEDTEITLANRQIELRDREASKTWVQAMVGAKLGVQVSDPVTLWLRGDIAGFDWGADTDMSWNIIAGADWWVSRNISLQFAYRFYGIEYGNGSGNDEFQFEQKLNGPMLSATFHF